MKKHIIAEIIILSVSICLFAVSVYSLYNQNVSIANVGVVKAVGVAIYQDENLTEPLTVIDWGTLYQGTNKTYMGWIRNEGNSLVRLVLWTENWNPMDASNWLTLTWDYNGDWIPVNGSIPVTFTLSVDENVSDITSFSFEIWIRGVD